MKFGGSSIGNADRITNTADIVKSNIDKKPVVIVSAVEGITDKLIELGNASAEGKGNDSLDNINKIHYEILEKLELDKSLVDKNIGELSTIINKIKNDKKIDNKIFE